MLPSIHIPETTCSHGQFNISWVKAAFSKHSRLLVSDLQYQQKQYDKSATNYQPTVLLDFKIPLQTLQSSEYN